MQIAKNSTTQAEIQDELDQVNSSIDPADGKAGSGDEISMVNRLITDPNSPYYLHYGDNTGMQLISIELTEENYATWSCAVIMALNAKNKEGFVDGSFTKPHQKDPFYELWEKLENYRPNVSGTDYKSEDQIMQFLMELDDQFSHVSNQILLMDPMRSLNKVFALILQDERQKEVVAKKQKNFDATAFVGKMVHNSIGNQRASSFNQLQRKDKPICSHCGMVGHLKSKCYNLIGYHLGHRLAKGKAPVANAIGPIANSGSDIVNFLSNITITRRQCQQIWPFNDSIVGDKWILDTGASEYMVCSIKHLMTVNARIKAIVRLPNGDSALATHIGTIKLFNTLILTNVLDLSTCTTIGIGTLEDGLYHLQQPEHQCNDQSSIHSQQSTLALDNSSSVNPSLKCNNSMSFVCNSTGNVTLQSKIDIWHCRNTTAKWNSLSINTNTFSILPEPLNSKPICLINFGVSSSHNHLKVLGCLCYASLIKRNRTKFDPRVTPCVFLGYPYGIKISVASQSDLMANGSAGGPKYPISDYLDYSRPSPSHRYYALALSMVHEPQSFVEAAKNPDWCKAMDAEYQALVSNNTWFIVPLPSHKTPVACRWVFKVKLK
ncbi:uncharacterized protein LOC111378089 [Olea europaea var. sylvestris]|uniref:uncharacterized protein LOC111378089 n=1 Tax=Olea europaea var. sylvestris TaxID=158386 RepID=UPI000C1D645A|nr:uncharacterized protein LOC111378089 [Olea europaea var. sylvestris]